VAIEHPWPEPPAGGETIEVAPGIQWLRMPLPFQLDHINLWLLADGDGWTIIDTGVALDPTRERWERIFATRLEGRPVRRVLVTHFHPDHIGNAAWLAERWRAELWCTQTEWLAAEYALRSRDEADLDRRVAYYRRNGVAEDATATMRRRGNPYPLLVSGLPFQFMPIAEGETVTIGGRAWRVITARGHSPEHACLWCEEAGVLIAGDQVLPKITTNVSVWPERPRENPLRYYLDSLARVRPLGVDALVLPSHGLPFRGLHDRLDALEQHHEARLSEAADVLTEPRTAADLVPVLFRRELDAHHLGFAIGETVAHLNFLEAEGRAVRVTGRDGVERFHKS
jgi:glyoxylase-like metal-dependent hydrolase (beta-lactamase superfamily II)